MNLAQSPQLMKPVVAQHSDDRQTKPELALSSLVAQEKLKIF